MVCTLYRILTCDGHFLALHILRWEREIKAHKLICLTFPEKVTLSCQTIFMQEAINEAPIAAGRPFRSSSTSSETKASKLYVGELDSAVNESDLFAVFSELGKVSSLRISRDAITGISLGYGFIEYDPSQSGR